MLILSRVFKSSKSVTKAKTLGHCIMWPCVFFFPLHIEVLKSSLNPNSQTHIGTRPIIRNLTNPKIFPESNYWRIEHKCEGRYSGAGWCYADVQTHTLNLLHLFCLLTYYVSSRFDQSITWVMIRSLPSVEPVRWNQFINGHNLETVL